MFTRTNNKVMFNDKTYLFVKRLVQIVLPAIGSLYFSLGGIWNLPTPDKVVGTITVVTTFLGVCLGISSKQYDTSGAAYDGEMIVTEIAGKKTLSLELNGDPEELVDKDTISFKAKPVSDS